MREKEWWRQFMVRNLVSVAGMMISHFIPRPLFWWWIGLSLLLGHLANRVIYLKKRKKHEKMETLKIDMNLVRKNLPERAVVHPIKKGNVAGLEIKVEPSMKEYDFEVAKDKQRDLIGQENISEIYTEETGHHWYVFLNRDKAIEFENTTDEDINSFMGMEIAKDGGLNPDLNKGNKG